MQVVEVQVWSSIVNRWYAAPVTLLCFLSKFDGMLGLLRERDAAPLLRFLSIPCNVSILFWDSGMVCVKQHFLATSCMRWWCVLSFPLSFIKYWLDGSCHLFLTKSTQRWRWWAKEIFSTEYTYYRRCFNFNSSCCLVASACACFCCSSSPAFVLCLKNISSSMLVWVQ